MSSRKRTVLIVAVLGVALLMAGCTSALSGDDGNDVETDGMTADEIQTKAVNASQSVETATFTQELTMDVSGQGSISMQTEGAMDLNAEKMRMEGTMDMPQGAFDVTQYIIGDQMYVQTDGVWQKQTTQQNIWDQGQYRQQQQALESASEVEVVDKTTTSGSEVYVMEVDVDEDELLDLVEQQSVGQGQGMGQMYDQMEIKNVEMTQHIDTESYQIRKMEIEMDISMMGEEMSMSMTQTYDSINEPVDITLPEEAEGAREAGTAY